MIMLCIKDIKNGLRNYMINIIMRNKEENPNFFFIYYTNKYNQRL